MSYIGTGINDSAVIAGIAKNAFPTGAVAVAYDADGKMVAAGAGVNAIGILLIDTENVAAGDTLNVQIKECGLWKAGGEIAAGAEITSDANGLCVEAAEGNFITAIALESASAAGQIIRVQICKSGYKA